MIRIRCGTAMLVGALWLALPSTIAAQTQGPLVQLRGIGGIHLDGLKSSYSGEGVERDRQDDRMAPAWGLGLGASIPLVENTAGARLDFDLLLAPRLRRTPTTSHDLEEVSPSRAIRWGTASVWVRPGLLCGHLCITASVGGGIGAYNFDYAEALSDVVVPFLKPQVQPVLRWSVHVIAPATVPGLVLEVAGYSARLDHAYNGELTALHVLSLGVGYAWNPNGT